MTNEEPPALHVRAINLVGQPGPREAGAKVIADSVPSKQIDDLEPTLMRHGDPVKVLCELLTAGLPV